MAKLGGRNGSGIAVVDRVVTTVPKVVEVRGGGKVGGNGERITMLRMGPVAAVDVIGIAIVIETILSGIGSAPSGSREGETGMIIGGGGRVGVRVVTDGLGVGSYGGLVVRITDCAGTVEELSLSSITG